MKGPDAFEAYYRCQKVICDDEWLELKSCLDSPLPVTFTVVENFPGGLGRQLLHDIRSKRYPDIHPISWYPGSTAWQIESSRSQWTSEFKEFIKVQTEIGTMIRQELVSMVPVLMLRDGMLSTPSSVLDLCAAPGSKTSQLVQFFDGVVVANDCDARRASMLMSRLKCVASSSLVVTRCDAAQFPSHEQFDRVLCDVPCSGDGTMRKAPKLHKNWKSTSATALHLQQIQIARRAFLLTKPGGRMVYSTCSLNPVENEAVVLALLNEFPDEIELVDSSEVLPGLKRSNGLTTWPVMAAKLGDTGFSLFGSWDEVKSTSYGGQCVPSVFATGPHCHLLSRCMRLLPHHNNSEPIWIGVFWVSISIGVLVGFLTAGGFFIALIERRFVPSPRSVPTPLPPKYKGDSLFPFLPLLSTPGGSEIAECLRRTIGLRDTFPFDDVHIREHADEDSHGRRHRLYLLTPKASSHAAFHTDSQGLMHAGVRVFERCVRPEGVPTEFRICWEAIGHILPHLSSDIVKRLPLSLLTPLLRSETVSFDSVPGLKEELFGEDGVQRGNIVIECRSSSDIPLLFAARVGAQTVQLMIPTRSFEAATMLL